MKKYLHNSLRVLFLSLAVLLSLPMLAAQVEIDGINYELNVGAKQATVVSKSGEYSGEVVIPESVEHEDVTFSVTSIRDRAFQDCSGLISVAIGNSVTSIGYDAFSYCRGLTSVTIGNCVRYIQDNAFFGCSGMTSVTIGNSVTSIGNDAFANCHKLTSVHISDISAWCNIYFGNSFSNPLYYAHHLYMSGEEVKELVIPNSVTSIGESAFADCSSLTSVTIPNSVKSIRKSAFIRCSSLTSVHISDIAAWCNIDFADSYSNPLHHAHHLYMNGEEVKDLVIPNSVTNIGSYAFAYCDSLTSVAIGNSVESIGKLAFNHCSTLSSVIIPNSVTSIGNDAFSYCRGLTSVTIPNSVNSIGDYAFASCSGLTKITIGNGVTSIGDWAFRDCRGLTSVTIPNSVNSIGDYAFASCSGLTKITIGNGVTSIGNRAYGCPELLDVYCYAENVPSTESDAFENSYPEYATLHVPDASIESYKAEAPWSSFGKIVALPNEFNLSVSSVGYATLFLDFNAEIPANVQAYTGVKVVDNSLKMERIEGVLPANTGVIIKADEGTYIFAKSDAIPVTIDDNLLYGTVATTQISTDPSYSYYVLSEVDGIVGMYLAKLTDGKFQNNANKAYMMLKKGDLGIYDEEVDTGTEQLSRGFVFDFGEETSIDELKCENGKRETAVYDLSGRRVQKGQKGVFIQNGKVMVK